MDGAKTKMKHSLQFRLSAWLSVAVFAVGILAGIFSFVTAFHDANELQDDQLRQLAAFINQQRVPLLHLAETEEIPDSEPEDRISVRLLQPLDAQAVESPGALAGLPLNLPDGMQTVSLPGDSWRVLVTKLDAGSRIALGQRTAMRDEIAYSSAWRTLLPLLALIPILLILMGYLVRTMFKPLKSVALDLDGRIDDELHGINEAQLPSEIQPFVVAINRLLGRVAQSVALQRRFVADAAHELRSPLTALSLQAERLASADMSAEARARLAVLTGGIQRNRRLLDQLLTLAREQDAGRTANETVSIQQVFRQVLEELMPLAEEKNIDLGVLGEEDAQVRATEAALKTLVTNLVSNAIRYTPRNGQIDLSIESSPANVTLLVCDTGPGIAPEERERVFDPFYRVLGSGETGSGLGLAIVKTIALRLGAQLGLSYANDEEKTGLCARVTFDQEACAGHAKSQPDRSA